MAAGNCFFLKPKLEWLASADLITQNYRISPEGTRSIPNFSLQGRPNIPELLSNKVILTPVAPGNQRGAVWGDNTLQHQNWIADVEFRANGPERGGGNLNIWLVRDGAHIIGSDSVYTAGRFEGLALVIDQHSGSGGMLRGFLNDGTTDYRSHQNVDNLAFGHCTFSYRNLGRPTQIKLRHTETKFSVEVAGRLCFESDKIRLPSGYHFGLTAASADNPDSFEVFKLVVLTGDNNHEYANANANNQQQQQDSSNQGGSDSGGGGKKRMFFGRGGQNVVEDPYDNVIPDSEAETISSSKAQFADLHNRLQSVNHHLSSIFRSIAQNAGVDEQRHAEMSVMIGEVKGLLTRLEKLEVLERRMADVEREMRSMHNEIKGRLADSENSIKYHVSDKHEALSQKVKVHTKSGHTKLILVVVGSQMLLVGAFIYYKRRKTSPKKYL
jgi:mannose-binding lectin 1